MSYAAYVAAAYAVFIAVLLWDYVDARLRIRRQLRASGRAGVPAAHRAQPLVPRR